MEFSFKSANRGYTYRFEKHLKSFVENYELFGPRDSLMVAVSGGIDSMALCFALHQLQRFGYSNEVRVVHIHHGTRDGQDQEAELVESFCEYLGFSYELEKFDDLNPKKNFEYQARLKRYETFYKLSYAHEKILLAHHIDDSFEWTLLQSLRSSSINGLVGIPLKNDQVVRPFMCVTKKQILNYAAFYDIPFLEDPTNEQIKYERNFLRKNVVSAFKDRYQQYLKHYVFRHNEIARRLGVHLKEKNRSDYRMVKSKKAVLIYSLHNQKTFDGIERLLEDAVKYLNPNGRGTLSKQLNKIKLALENHKLGPFVLTKGIKAYLDYHMVLLTLEEPPILESPVGYSIFSYDEFYGVIQEYLSDPHQSLAFPFFVQVSGSSIDKRQFKTTFNTSAPESFDSPSYYPALRLLREWSKKRNMHKALRLKIMLVKP